jgi:hypothetical protein
MPESRMTLDRFAYRVSGPIDATINLAINTAIPGWLLPWDGRLPVFGLPSAFVFIGTMTFCVGLLATFFGVRNGVLRRAAGAEPGPLPPEVRWVGYAWRTGLVTGLIGWLLAGASFLALSAITPEVPCSLVIVGDGALAGALGYCCQVRGVLLARAL